MAFKSIFISCAVKRKDWLHFWCFSRLQRPLYERLGDGNSNGAKMLHLPLYAGSFHTKTLMNSPLKYDVSPSVHDQSASSL